MTARSDAGASQIAKPKGACRVRPAGTLAGPRVGPAARRVAPKPAATTAKEYEDLLKGKVLVSMANALVKVGPEFQPLVPPRGSVAAHVQAAMPESRVVAAFHHLPAKELGHLGEPIDSDVLICGDDPKAIETVSEIVGKIPGCRPLDAGELSNATAIEAFTAVLLQLNVRYRTRVAPKLTGIRDASLAN